MLSTGRGVRTLGIDLGATRTAVASGGVALPLGLPSIEDPVAALGTICSAVRLAPAEVAAIAVVGDPEQGARLIEAGREAGLGAIATIAAPVAIALAYAGRISSQRVAVYQLGSRRFDVSVVERRGVVAQQAAAIGGADVDHAIARYVAARIARTCGWDLAADAEVWARLLVEAERAKLRLARDEVTSIDVAHADPSAPTQLSTIALDRRGLRDLAAEVVASTLALCEDALRDAGRLDAVVLGGGSALLPGLREDVGARLGLAVLAEVDPRSAAAIGASLAQPGSFE